MAAGPVLAILLAAAPAQEDSARLLAGMPDPVRALVDRRWSCYHWAGEEPYDPDRARAIAQALRAGRCDRIDRDEAAIRRRYAGRSDILRVIEETRGRE